MSGQSKNQTGAQPRDSTMNSSKTGLGIGSKISRNRSRLAGALLGGLLAGLSMAPIARAQTSPEQTRAANLARMEAERINGGLSKYFPANCMYQESGQGCLIKTNENGYLFKFLGGIPGWETNKIQATVQTEILVAPDGKAVKSVIYNGAVRAN